MTSRHSLEVPRWSLLRFRIDQGIYRSKYNRRKKPLNTINLNCHTLSKAQEELPASVRGPDEIFGCDGVREELRRQQRKPDSGQKLRQVEAALLGIELDPTHHRREDDLLGGNVKLVVGQKFLHLLENSIISV